MCRAARPMVASSLLVGGLSDRTATRRYPNPHSPIASAHQPARRRDPLRSGTTSVTTVATGSHCARSGAGRWTGARSVAQQAVSPFLGVHRRVEVCVVTITEREREAVAPPAGPSRRTVGWLPAAALVAGVVGLLLAVHTPLPDLARYVGYLLWAVLLPGILVYRALRRTPHSLLDDLATGTALGLVLEIAAYLLASVTGLRSVLPAWPLLVVVPFAAVPALRVHWRRPGYRHRVPAAWSWTVVGVALWYVAYLTDAFLRANQPVPVNRPQYYMIDQLWLMAITGDAKHHVPPANPGVGAEPLRYHWFAFAHTTVGSLISGVDVPMVMF